MKKVTVGYLLDKGLIKRSTKVALLDAKDLKKANLIKCIRCKGPMLVTAKKLAKKGLVKKK